MIEPPQVPDGCRVIPLWRNVSGNNWRPVHEIVGYTIVDEIDFDRLNRYRWFMLENRYGDCYAVRSERQGRKSVNIYMAREILGLPCGTGHGSGDAEHKDHNTLNNRRGNLRRATRSQNMANTRGHSSTQRFKGVYLCRSKYGACVVFNGLKIWFTTVPTDVEAALMYNYAAIVLQDKFAKLNVIPEDEVSSQERRWELMGMVVVKLMKKGLI